MTLSADQNKAVRQLSKVKVGALFMEPGTGKTLTAIELINTTDTDYCLFIVPFSTKENLSKELVKWNFSRPYRIVGVETLSSSDRTYLDIISDTSQANHAFVIVDESLKIKNVNAIRTQRTIEIGRLAEYKLILNGTPISKNILDLWPQMNFLSPKILKMTENEFKDTFVSYVKFKEDGKWHEFIKNYHNLDYLYSIIAPFVFDAKLNLSKKQKHVSVDYLITERIEQYETIRDNFLNNFMNDPNVFIKMTQSMQMAYCDEPVKLNKVSKLIDDNTIIFCKFIRSKNTLLEAFPTTKVLTYGTGSLGLNLQEYNKIIFFDKTFDYAQQEQAERRIYRMGQSEDVIYYHLTGDVGLESMIDRNIKNKVTMLSAFKKAAMENKGKELIANL